MSKDVFITKLSKFLPNAPVSNDEMEEYLGKVNGKPSKAKSIVLRNNGIKTRYYTLDKNGNSTHSNAEITQLAIEKLWDDSIRPEDLELLTCGTTSPDQLLPSHASMVHGKLALNPIELVSFGGSCCSGVHGLKYAWMALLAGLKNNAICTGSERLAQWMLARNFEEEAHQLELLEQNPFIAFEKEFLRWMLSDGSAALYLSTNPGKDLSLKIDWIECTSFAGEYDTCMYMGAEKAADGSLTSWSEFYPKSWLENSTFSLRQDTKVLAETIVPLGGKFLLEIIKRRGFDIQSIDYFLPHLSSMFFKGKIKEELDKLGLIIPEEKWFTNLSWVGNVGSASIFLMLEELFYSGKLKKGQKILLMIPESARFNYAYGLLTVV